jgi:hypothetical protein
MTEILLKVALNTINHKPLSLESIFNCEIFITSEKHHFHFFSTHFSYELLV